MALSHGIIAALLALAVLVEIASCAAVLIMTNPLRRLHYAGPATMICPVLVAAAISVSKHPFSGASLKAWFIALVLVVWGPVLSHALGRAAVARRGPEHG